MIYDKEELKIDEAPNKKQTGISSVWSSNNKKYNMIMSNNSSNINILNNTNRQDKQISKVSNEISFKTREKKGKFELIFPFNKSSEDLAISLNKC